MSIDVRGFTDQVPQRLERQKGWPLGFRAVAAISLIVFLFLYFDFSKILDRLTSIDVRYAFLALVILSMQYLLSCVRWHFIVRSEDRSFSFRRSYSIYGLGALANVIFFTSLAGLSFKGLLLLREKMGISKMIAALLVERLAAVGGMVLCILAGFVISHQLLIQQFSGRENWSSGLWLGALLVLLSGVVGALLWRLPVIKQTVAQIRESFFSAKAVIVLMAVSAGIIVIGFAGVAVLAAGMSIKVPLLFFVSVMPVVALIASLPISVGGWGIREGSMVVGLALFDVPAETALALSVAYGFAGIMVACIFGAIASLIYMLILRDRPQLGSVVDAN